MTSARRKVAVATWRAPKEARLYARLELDAGAVLDRCAELTRESGVVVTPSAVVGVAVQRAVEEVPAFHRRVVLGRVVPFRSYDVGFAVDVEDGEDLAPTKVLAVDRKSVVEVARELAAGAARVRSGNDPAFRSAGRLAGAVPWFALRPLLGVASVVNGGFGRPMLGQPGHPLGSLFVTNIGSLGLDEGFVTPVPFARVPLYVCVGAVHDAVLAVDGEPRVRPRLVLTATADHRLVDGAHAARLARVLRRLLADPAQLDR